MKDKVGIYIIMNINNLHFYVGSSVHIDKRISTHKRELRKGIHHSKYLQRSWDLYGEDSFVFEVVQETSVENLKALEQKYLNEFLPVYNVSKSADCPMLGRKHSESTIEKFKARVNPSGPDSTSYGTKWSEELRIKILKARIGYKHSESTKLKMRETSLKNNQVKYLDKSREESKKKVIDSQGNEFSSLVEAGKFWSISTQTVCDILKGRSKKTRNGIVFKYKESA